ncbi:hypothetical protein BUALT_Bualt03G0194100 [Buddleja alternifolia]|uniref:Uncharacterized protein n=1 Tax=Buddleja alternifolia TaxID=168488 RepID=A0AAV6Y369_9LAMI|nr:hypothetical protein BUALT_Bualt03G0194100 [Buddleja alternifolia]
MLIDIRMQEGLTVPDQIDEAVEYIKNLKMRVEECRQKKESLLPRKRSHSHCTTNYKMSPLVEIHDMGPNMDVILANGLQDYSTFYPMISWLHLHGFEIVTANFCRDGNSTIQVGKSKLGFGGATMSGMQKDLVCGTSHSEVVESHLNLWDYEIETNIWGSQFPNGSM